VAKVNLGEKQVCPECEKKFYDLTKRPALCPYCQTSFDPAAIAAPPLEEEPEVVAAEEQAEPEAETVDEDEATAKELELDGDAANFTGGDEGDDEASSDAPDMDGFSTSDEEDGTSLDEENEERPPTGNNDDDDAEEVEV